MSFLWFRCCEVGEDAKYASEDEVPKCWMCGLASGMWHFEINEEITAFRRIGTVVRPTLEVPPWRV